jgi:hypothetical protein
VVWRGDAQKFARAVTVAAGELMATVGDDASTNASNAAEGRQAAVDRLQHWVVLLSDLAAPASR